MFILFITIFGWCDAAQEISSCPAIIHYIEENLVSRGVLKQSEGLIYIDIDDEYIRKLLPFIQKEGFEEPPYFGKSDLVGAHITVIYPHEIQKYGIETLSECGELIQFTPKECLIVHPPRWKEIDEIYLIVVEAPELDQLREKYGLPKREYDFHITIGVKPKIAKSA